MIQAASVSASFAIVAEVGTCIVGVVRFFVQIDAVVARTKHSRAAFSKE